MKSLILTLFFIFASLFFSQYCLSQVILFERESDTLGYELPLLVFSDSLAADTIKGIIKVIVTFNKNINEQKVTANKVEVEQLILKNKHSIDINYSKSSKSKKRKKKEKILFNTYSNIFIDLYMQQPYSELKGRKFQQGNRLGFIYKFVIVPNEKW